jgi:hypothetical protein
LNLDPISNSSTETEGLPTPSSQAASEKYTYDHVVFRMIDEQPSILKGISNRDAYPAFDHKSPKPLGHSYIICAKIPTG